MAIVPREGAAGGALALFGVEAGPRAGEELPVRLPLVGIGRGRQNELVLDDDSVSAQHARLEYADGGWRLTDLNSTNGTFVEGVRLAPEVPTPLAHASAVQFGGVRLHFRALDEADVEAARAAYEPPPPPETIAGRRVLRIPVWLVAVALLVILLAIFYFSGVFTGGEAPIPGLALPPLSPLPPWLP